LDFDIWTAETPDGLIRWANVEPWITGPSMAAIRLEEALIDSSEDVAVAPLGPFYESTPKEPYAVAAMIRQMWPTAIFSDDAPDLEAIIPALPDGAVN
jgi:hypothetical protein